MTEASSLPAGCGAPSPCAWARTVAGGMLIPLVLALGCAPAPPPPPPSAVSRLLLEAPPPPPSTPTKVSYRLHALSVEVRAGLEVGSGLVLGPRTIVTSARVVSKSRTVQVMLRSPGHPLQSVSGKVIGIAPDLDLAMIETPNDLQLWALFPTMAPYAGLPPGSPLYLGAFRKYGGGFSELHISSARSVSMEQSQLGGMYRVLANIEPGDRGAPVMDLDGHVRGIISTALPGRGWVVPAEHVRVFYNRYWGPRPVWDETKPQLELPAANQEPDPRLSLVSVRTANGLGVGVVLATHKGRLLVATSSRLVSGTAGTETIEVQGWSAGRSLGRAPAELVLINLTQGLALLWADPVPGLAALPLAHEPPGPLDTPTMRFEFIDHQGRPSSRAGSLGLGWRWPEVLPDQLPQFELQPEDLGGLVFDPEDTFVGLAVKDANGLGSLIPMEWLAAARWGQFGRTRLAVRSTGGECAIAGTLEYFDPLETVKEVGLTLSRFPPRRDSHEALVPMGYPIASVLITGKVTRLSATVKPCPANSTLYLQWFSEGVGGRWRGPIFVVVDPSSAEVSSDGELQPGPEAPELPAAPLPELQTSPCGLQDWGGCQAGCERDHPEECLAFGEHYLLAKGTELQPADVEVALKYFTRACRAGGVPLACAAVLELQPAAPVRVSLAEASKRCSGGSLLDCLLAFELGASPPRAAATSPYKYLCTAGVGAACVKTWDGMDGDAFDALAWIQFGCSLSNAQACLRISLDHQWEMSQLQRKAAAQACALGLQAGCASLVKRSPGGGDGGVVMCFGGECSRLPEYSKGDLAAGPPTTLDAVVVERVKRLHR